MLVEKNVGGGVTQQNAQKFIHDIYTYFEVYAIRACTPHPPQSLPCCPTRARSDRATQGASRLETATRPGVGATLPFRLPCVVGTSFLGLRGPIFCTCFFRVLCRALLFSRVLWVRLSHPGQALCTMAMQRASRFEMTSRRPCCGRVVVAFDSRGTVFLLVIRVS